MYIYTIWFMCIIILRRSSTIDLTEEHKSPKEFGQKTNVSLNVMYLF